MLSINTQQMTARNCAATDSSEVRRLRNEVKEGCLWLEGKNPRHRELIVIWLGLVSSNSDSWWRQRMNKSLGWWLTCAGVPGYMRYYLADGSR